VHSAILWSKLFNNADKLFDTAEYTLLHWWVHIASLQSTLCQNAKYTLILQNKLCYNVEKTLLYCRVQSAILQTAVYPGNSDTICLINHRINCVLFVLYCCKVYLWNCNVLYCIGIVLYFITLYLTMLCCTVKPWCVTQRNTVKHSETQ